MDEAPTSKKVYNLTTGQIGERTGESYECPKDGCNGLRFRVQWEAGGYTTPCTSTMVYQQRASRDTERDIEVEAGSWVIPYRTVAERRKRAELGRCE